MKIVKRKIIFVILFFWILYVTLSLLPRSATKKQTWTNFHKKTPHFNRGSAKGAQLSAKPPWQIVVLLLFWLFRLKQSPFPFEQRVQTNAHGKAFKRIRFNNGPHVWRQQQGQQHFFAPSEIQHDKKNKPTHILVAPLSWCFNAKNERAGHQKARPPPKKTANVVPGQQQTKCIHHHMCTSSDYPFTIQRHHKCGRLNRNNSIER